MSEPKQDTKTSWTNRRIAWAMVFTALVLTVGVNLVVHRASRALALRADLTSEGVYTLDALSRRVVSKAPEPIQVRVFLSDDLPVPFHKTDQVLSDILDEYVAASNGNLSYELINPGDDDDNEEAAKGHGCERVSIGSQSETQMSLRAIYKCVAVLMGTRQVVIKDLMLTGNPATDNLELALTRAMLELQQTRTRKIGFVGGLGGVATSEEFAKSLEPVFAQYYSSTILPVPLDLNAPSIPEDIDVVMLIGVEEDVPEQGIRALDAFVQRGGSVGWFKSPVTQDIDRIQRAFKAQEGKDAPAPVPNYVRASSHNLAPLLKTWGVELMPGLVLDRAHGMRGRVQTQQGDALITHPANFQLTDLDRSVPFLAQAPPLVLPAAGALRLSEQVLGSGQVEAKAIIKSAPEAVLRTQLPDTLGYEQMQTPQPGAKPGVYVMGATLQGVFPRHFQDAAGGEAAKPARLLALSSDTFMQPNQELGYGPQLLPIGQRLFVDAVGWLAQDTSLSRIRSKARASFMGEVDAARTRQIQWINIVLVPLGFALIGGAMALRRRLRRRRIKQQGQT